MRITIEEGGFVAANVYEQSGRLEVVLVCEEGSESRLIYSGDALTPVRLNTYNITGETFEYEGDADEWYFLYRVGHQDGAFFVRQEGPRQWFVAFGYGQTALESRIVQVAMPDYDPWGGTEREAKRAVYVPHGQTTCRHCGWRYTEAKCSCRLPIEERIARANEATRLRQLELNGGPPTRFERDPV